MWANRAEQYVDIFNKVITKDLKYYNAPLVIWCYFYERLYKTINYTACDKFQLNGQTPHTLITFHTTDISHM